MNTYFITGGAGFIGSTLSEKLLEKDAQALRYLEELITRSHFLQNEINKIQAVETNRDSRFKKFR